MPSEPFDLEKLKAIMEEQPENTEVAKVEERELDEEKKLTIQKTKALKLQNKTIRQNIRQRRKYAFRIFVLIVCWIISILVILIMDGFAWYKFHLADTVLITLITTTTATIFGLFVLVTRYLFSTKEIEKINSI